MSYEREAMPDSVNVNPAAQAAPIMREERTLNPYQPRPTSRGTPPPTYPTPPPPVGQADTTKETAALPTEEQVRLSPQVAALARREQKFRQEQAALAKEKAQMDAERAEIAQLKAMKEKLAAKDYSALDGLVDYNEYSQHAVNRLNGTDPVQEEIKKLNGKLSEFEKQAQENVTRQFEAAVQERRNAALDLVNKGDSFPSIKKANAHEAVVQHIMDTWEHDSKELSVEQAAKEVEEILLERARQWASLLEEKKAETTTTPTAGEKKQLPPLKPALKTLTNQVTAGDFGRPRPLHMLSDNERWAEARRRAEAKLQSQSR